jgi:hypothetical protein
MSDEPLRLADGMTPAPRENATIKDHRCEHPGCAKWAGFGFSRPRQEPHWYCFEHRDEGERFL